jgi:hypothetical protein
MEKVMSTEDDEHLKRIASMKAEWDRLAKKGLASGNDRWVTEASRRKADIHEEESEAKKDGEITERIIASGDIEAMRARMQELKVVSARRSFRVHTWATIFPSKKPRSS